MFQIKNLTFSIQKKDLLKDVNTDFELGKIYGIIGPNGSGKTTLLKNLCGILTPSHGEVLWNGENLLNKKRKEISQLVSFVPPVFDLAFDYLVYDLVVMALYPFSSMSNLDKHERTKWALEVVDAWQFRNRGFSFLSTGEKQRVFIARSLAIQPPTLLLDEPTSALDIQHQLEIWGLLEQLKQHNKLIIVAVHDLSMAQRFCDEILVIQEGRIVCSGLAEEVVSDELLRDVFGVCRDLNQPTPTLTLPKNS